MRKRSVERVIADGVITPLEEGHGRVKEPFPPESCVILAGTGDLIGIKEADPACFAFDNPAWGLVILAQVADEVHLEAVHHLMCQRQAQIIVIQLSDSRFVKENWTELTGEEAQPGAVAYEGLLQWCK